MRVFEYFLRVVLYVVPLLLLLSFSWNTCGRGVWAERKMVQVEGVLTRIETQNHPPFSNRGGSVEVEFVYSYDDRNYVGKAMTFCPLISSGSKIDRIYEMYHELLPKAGKSVTIWVDPSNPDNSVLYKYIPWSAMLILFFILFFGFFILKRLDRFLTDFIRSGAKNSLWH